MRLSRFLPFFQKRFTFSQLLPSWKIGKPIWNEWSVENAIQNGYKSSTYVYACINLIAKSTASVPWVVMQRKGRNKWEPVPEHPLQLLIEKPNPFMSQKDFFECATQHLYLGGNGIFTKVRAGGTISELWNLPPDSVYVLPSREKFIDGYIYVREGIRLKFDVADIMHFKFLDPSNPYWGFAPIQAGAKVIDTDIEALNWNKVSMQNRAITDGVFTFDSPLTKDQWEDARTMVREQHQGIENSRSPWVLGSGAKWQQMSLSPAEMDFIESRRFTRQEICGIFQVPPPMVGIYDDATLANIETARKIFWQDTVVPYMEDLKNTMNTQLTPEFGDDLYLDFDLSGVEALQTNLTEKITNAKALWSMGVPFNDINQKLELGFDEVEGGDIGYLPTGLMPADLMGAPQEPTGEPPQDGTPPPKGFTPENIKDAVKGLNLPSKAHKEYYWKSFERRREAWYFNMTRKSASLFKSESEAVQKAIAEQGLNEEAINKAIDSHRQQWTKFFVATWQNIVEEFGKETWTQLKSVKASRTKDESQDAFDPWDENIQQFIVETTASKIKNVLEFTKGDIAQMIYDMRTQQEDPATVDDIARAIKSKYDDFSRYRSYRIARTEVVGASNYGSWASANQTGLKLRREWITSKDSRVRKSHEHIDGEVRGLNEKFSIGVMYPADYRADKPAETIHCRCAVSYITD